MTLYVNLRDMAGGIEPDVLERLGPTVPPRVRVLQRDRITGLCAGREVLLAVHGFNVSYNSGIESLAQLRAAMALPAQAVFVGVLWPGDFWIPVVNYPFEASDAVRCGKLLAAFCDRRLASAASISFVSHSLGGRVVLEAVRHMGRRARSMCLTAAAVDRDVLTGHYSDALASCDRTYVLSSTRDKVLRYAYPAGDFLSDLFGDPDSPFRAALGLRGPNPGAGATVTPSAIAPAENCDHRHYLSASPVGQRVAGYAARAFGGAPHSWP